jgi:hypothetical protein
MRLFYGIAGAGIAAPSYLDPPIDHDTLTVSSHWVSLQPPKHPPRTLSSFLAHLDGK